MEATKTHIKGQMRDILTDITWANISKKYFGKSRGWIYQKMNGIDGNGKEVDFSDSEKESLKNALNDLAARIQTCADKI